MSRPKRTTKPLHPAKAREILKALVKIGFVPRHSKGSHVLMKHTDGRTTTVPVHPSFRRDRPQPLSKDCFRYWYPGGSIDVPCG